MLQQRLAISVVLMEDMGMEGMEGIEDMEDTDIMERDLLKLMLSLNLFLEEDMLDMVMEVMEVMDMDVDTMAREKPEL